MDTAILSGGEPFADRWVRIMADHCAEGVWLRSGGAGEVADLPVSPELAARILAWQARYDADALGGGFDVGAFARDGLAIARAVKAELPAWTVVYFDEARVRRRRARGVYEYEVAAVG